MQLTLRPPLGHVTIPLRRLAAAFPRLPKLSAAVILAVVLTTAGAGLLTGRVLPAANQIDLRFRYAPPWPLAPLRFSKLETCEAAPGICLYRGWASRRLPASSRMTSHFFIF